jgi:hypothetical protein
MVRAPATTLLRRVSAERNYRARQPFFRLKGHNIRLVRRLK